jgi:DNA-nicking Smr family endonuclease
MSRKPFEVADQNLWEEIRKSILPFGLKPGGRAKLASSASHALPVQFKGPVVTPRSRTNQQRSEPPALAAFDRRLSQKLSRGQLDPESRIDLHGESVETARMRLYHFLQTHHRQGFRLVLVITGKGASPYARHTLHSRDLFHTPEREGRLRREVPLWLHEAMFRTHVVGYQPAHPRHGGGGALYVKLRRNSGDVA